MIRKIYEKLIAVIFLDWYLKKWPKGPTFRAKYQSCPVCSRKMDKKCPKESVNYHSWSTFSV